MKKIISNTITVTTVEDGMWQQQIFYRSSSSTPPTKPAQSQIDNNLPSGWSFAPRGVTSSYRYEYVSQRTKDNGIWGEYSDPALYSYRAQDGTSISIQGVAIAIDPSTTPASARVGDAILYMSQDSNDDADIWEGTYWDGTNFSAGVGFILESNGHLYQRTRSGAATKWQDVGQIKGDKGDDAVSYQIIIDSASAIVKIDGKLYADFLCHVLKTVGSTQTIDATGSMYADGGQCGESNNSYDDDSMFDGVDVSPTKTEIRLEYKVNNVVVATSNIPIAITGRASRNLWYAGYWDDIKGQTFEVTDTSAPYVLLGWKDTAHTMPNCKAFNGENGTYTFPSNVAGYENSENWESMTSEFKYIITRAVFASLAKLGLWTFNANMMYSDLGINGQGSEVQQGNLKYTGIDAQGNTFTPNAALDASTGEASFSRDKVRFKPDGSGWLANKNIEWDASGNPTVNGIIRASLMYANVSTMENEQTGTGTYEIDLVNYPAYMFLVPTLVYGTAYIKLPYASNYEGVELRFYLPLPASRLSWNAVLQTRSSEKIVYPSLTNIIATEERATEYTLPQGRVVTLKSMKTYDDMGNVVTYWFVIGGYQQRGLNGEYQIGGKSVTIEEGRIISIT